MLGDNFKSIGLRDMHPMQIDALMQVLGTTVELAALTDDTDVISVVEHQCDELIKLFGGIGVKLDVEEHFKNHMG